MRGSVALLLVSRRVYLYTLTAYHTRYAAPFMHSFIHSLSLSLSIAILLTLALALTNPYQPIPTTSLYPLSHTSLPISLSSPPNPL